MGWEIYIGLLFWVAIGWGVWWLIRKLFFSERQTRIIPPAEGKDFEVITPAKQPLNSDIMRKLNSMHEDIDNIEARTKKLENQ